MKAEEIANEYFKDHDRDTEIYKLIIKALNKRMTEDEQRDIGNALLFYYKKSTTFNNKKNCIEM